MRRTTGPSRADRPAVAEVAAGAVVVEDARGAVLLLHHVDEDRWCLPKGHIEQGESVVDAARREITEETGLATFRLGEEIGEVAYRFYDPRRDLSVFKTTIYFLAFTSETRVRPEPLFDRHEWLEPSAARARVAYDSDREILARAARLLEDRRSGGSPSR